MKTRSILINVWAGLGLLACTPGGPAGELRPEDPTVAGAMGSSCLVPEDYGNPLVVDWNPEQRGNLEVAMRQGMVVVAYDCSTLKVLPNCTVAATYGFMGMNRKEQVIRLRDAGEVKANLPTSGGTIGAGLERGASLDVALVMVGKMTTTRTMVARDTLEGACQGATHFVRGATVGAFATQTGTKAVVSTAAQVFGAGAEASSSSAKSVMQRDGDLDACKTATPTASSPPSQCSALLRLNLVAIAPAKSVKQPDQGILATHGECPRGFGYDGAKCAALQDSAPYQCQPDDVNGCLAQCRVGHPGSCNNAGSLYFRGAGVARDLAKAASLFDKSCAAGFGTACFNLGTMQVEGMGISQDLQRARALFTKACEAGEPSGCSELGWMLVGGKGVEPDYEKGKRLFTEACLGGFPSGCVNLAYMYSAGQGVPKDYERALMLNRQACDGGGAGGCAALALMINRGWGVAPDPAKAAALYERACDGGSPAGCNGLGLAYLEGRGTRKDVQLATGLFEWACDAGSKDGCYDLGLMLSGEGERRDDAAAAEAFGAGCKLGHGLSCTELGRAHLQGRGVPTDRALGMQYLSKGCELGDAEACAARKKMAP